MGIRLFTNQSAIESSDEFETVGPNDVHAVQFKLGSGVTAMELALDTRITPETDLIEAYSHTATATEISDGYGKFTVKDVLADAVKLRLVSITGGELASASYTNLRRY
jgi:hypothetical protein